MFRSLAIALVLALSILPGLSRGAPVFIRVA
jgi:hypothetical protein